jgi:hypothetical protein
MKIDGACHCGRISYEAEIDPDDVTICHCTDCQTLSGSAFRIVVPAKREAWQIWTRSALAWIMQARALSELETSTATSLTPTDRDRRSR